MRVCVCLSETFMRYRGRIFAPLLGYEAFWSRYLTAFDEVLALARVKDVDVLDSGLIESTGPNVNFFPLPAFKGPWQFLAVRRQLRRLVARAVNQAEAFVLRTPSHVGTLAWRELRRRRWPYAVEVVDDPWLSLAPGSVKSVVRPFLRRLSPALLRRQCREATAASYVTAHALQRSYPPSPTAYTIGCSSIDLPDNHIVADLSDRQRRISTIPERLRGGPAPVRLGYIGTFNVLYKAPDVHIQAIEICRRRGLNVELVLIGDGTYRPHMQALAEQKGVGDYVQLPGRIPAGLPVMQFLDGVDLFLNASRQEGLPRALIEAMARGCPAIGSNITGIPELLPPSCLVPAADPRALADRIEHLLSDADSLYVEAEHNRDKAREYRRSVLSERRREFYQHLRRRTAEIRGNSHSANRVSNGSPSRANLNGRMEAASAAPQRKT